MEASAHRGTIPKVIEIIRSGATAARAKVAIFDFDGTLSVIRSGWTELMLQMAVKELAATGTRESEQELTTVANEFIGRLTGKETIYQMMALAEAVQARGGGARTPLQYKREYLEALNGKIYSRLQALRDGGAPEQFMVPGARDFLQFLTERGLTLYLASGTDDANVKEEAELLGLALFFPKRMFGAQDDLQSFSKAILVQRLISDSRYAGEDLVVFGDGFVEIEEVKRVGGTAIGVATDEPSCRQVDEWKKQRLVKAGADFIVPNFCGMLEKPRMIFSEVRLSCEMNS